MTNDIMCASISKFVEDPTKIIFTDVDCIPWFEVHTFSEDVLITTRNNAYKILHNVNNGEFKDEIKPFTKYVKSRGVVVQLFDEGGTGFLAREPEKPENLQHNVIRQQSCRPDIHNRFLVPTHQVPWTQQPLVRVPRHEAAEILAQQRLVVAV